MNVDQTVISGSTKFAKDLQSHNYFKDHPSIKNLQRGNKRIEDLEGAIKVNDHLIINDAKNILEIIEQQQYLKGRGLDAKVCTSVYMSMKKFGKKPDVNLIVNGAYTTE